MSGRNSRSGHPPETVTIAVLGVSGPERVKGSVGVGKSLLCNRFVRGDFDNFHTEHSSTLSQTDFSGSPVINNDHWLYWGENLLNNDDLYANANIRLIEQTEFVDDETFEALAGAGEDYWKRATRTRLESADKLMYICKEQLGLETEYTVQTLPEGRCAVDAFVYVFDVSRVDDRSFEAQSEFALCSLQMALKSKKPLVVAASKSDIADEAGRKALHRLLARKELKSNNIPVVEVSSFANVNVTGVFSLAVSLVERWKSKPKLLSFADALNLQKKTEREICERYMCVLRELMPIESWPQRRPTWSKLVNRVGLSRHVAYTRFIYVFGRSEAKKLYLKRVNEAREFWMQRRLQTQTPRLTHVFSDLIGADRARNLKWAEAKESICNHPLFDEYFQPLGALAADLDPSSPQVERDLSDARIPAELLLTTDAEPTYYEFQRAVDREYRRERLEEQFEQALAHCAQVTPGKPLQEVEIFLRGNPVYDALPTQLAFNIYDKFQEILVRKAEADFVELLLERVELLIGVVMRRRHHTHTIRPLIGLDDQEMSALRSVLHEDTRYRQLNRLFEYRDKMLSNYASFVSYPLVQNCPSGNRCIDSLLHDMFNSHLQRRQSLDSSQLLRINLVVVGEDRLVCDFTSAISKMLSGDIVENERGIAQVNCIAECDAPYDMQRSRTSVYLVDSVEALDVLKTRKLSPSHFTCPPLVVLTADPDHLDILPLLHQQCCMLANSVGGIFVGVGSESMTSARRSSDNELNTYFTRDQMSRVLDGAFSSQTDGRRLDARVQLSLMCGDQFPAQCVLNSLLSVAVHLTPSSSGGMATIEVPIASLKRNARIDLRLSSYHAWLVNRAPLPIHAHILAYSARRRASFAHAAAAARRLTEVSPLASQAILFIAVADVTDFFNDEETNALLTEGSELANKLCASFVTLSPEVAERLHTVTFVDFLERVLANRISHAASPTATHIPSDSGEYASVSEVTATGSVQWTLGSANTLQSDCTTTSRGSSGGSSRRAHKATRRSNSLSSARSLSLAVKPSCRAELIDRVMDMLPSTDRSAAQRCPSGGAMRLPTELSKAEIKQTAMAESAISFSIAPHVPFNEDAMSLAMASQHVAPLATPEHIEIASDYGTVKDALGVGEDDCEYSTLDFWSESASTTPLRDISTNSSNGSSHRTPISERATNLMRRLPGCHASTAQSPQSKTSASGSVSSSSPNSSMQLPLAGATPSSPSTSCIVPHTVHLAESSPQHLQPPFYFSKPVIAPLPFRTVPPPNVPRSAAGRLRRLHSISAESLLDAGIINSTNLYHHHHIDLAAAADLSSTESSAKKHSPAGFVRRVASSFRFRRGGHRMRSAEKKAVLEEDDESAVETSSCASASISGSRSVPHSPATERAAASAKRREAPSSSEKLSNAFSWLPSRSPKRGARSSNSDNSPRLNGVVASSDTLHSLAASTSDCMPVFVKKCIHYIEKFGGLETEGLYRVPGNQAQVIEFERAFVADNAVDLQRLDLPVHAVATALKNFLSALPEPLIPYASHDQLVACLEVASEKVYQRMHAVMEGWTTANRNTVSYLLNHLARVAEHADVNSMHVRNLAKVWWPTLFRPNFDSFESMAVFVTRLEMTTQRLISGAALDPFLSGS